MRKCRNERNNEKKIVKAPFLQRGRIACNAEPCNRLIATAILSVRLFLCLYVRHTLVLYLAE